MSKKTIVLWTAVLMILAIFAVSLPVVWRVHAENANEARIRNIQEQMDALEDRAVRKQINLAKWYNLNLKVKNPAPDSMQAYNSILAFSDGVMGYLEIPQLDLSVPVSHGTGDNALEIGVGHLEGSSLPIGGLGNHSVLIGCGDSTHTAHLRALSEGDLVYIHIPGETLAYAVESLSTLLPPQVAGFPEQEGKDLLTLVVETTTLKTVVRCSRTENLPAREMVHISPEEAATWKDNLMIPLYCAVAAGIIPMIVGCIGKAAERSRKSRRQSYPKSIKGK